MKLNINSNDKVNKSTRVLLGHLPPKKLKITKTKTKKNKKHML